MYMVWLDLDAKSALNTGTPSVEAHTSVVNYSSLSNTRVGFNKSVLDGNFTKNINVLPFYLKYFPVLVLQKHVLING